MNSKTGENEALVVLLQTYNAQVFTFYSMFFAICIGLLVVSLFALNASLAGNRGFVFVLRLMFFGVTLLLADAAVYCVSKTIYSGALVEEILHRLKLIGKGKSSMEHLTEIKIGLRNRCPTFQLYKMEDRTQRKALGRLYKLQIWASIVACLTLPAILFSLIWWNYDPFLDFVLGSELVYLFSLWVLFRYVPIM